MSDQPQELKTDELTAREVRAIKAIAKGEATPEQQTLAVSVVVTKFSRGQDVQYIPGSQAGSAFLAGRAFVGAQIKKHINLPIGLLTTEEVNDDE